MHLADNLKRSALLGALLLASCKAPVTAPEITVQDAWARPTLPGQSTSAAYFTIRNEGGGDRLLSVSSRAAKASLHSSSMEGGVMRMRSMESLEIPANSTVALEPGGMHVMLTGLKAPLEPGSAVPLDLEFDKSGTRHLTAAVRSSNRGVQ